MVAAEALAAGSRLLMRRIVIRGAARPYAGALHGWTMEDFPVYDHAAAERHWDELLGLYRATLG